MSLRKVIADVLSIDEKDYLLLGPRVRLTAQSVIDEISTLPRSWRSDGGYIGLTGEGIWSELQKLVSPAEIANGIRISQPTHRKIENVKIEYFGSDLNSAPAKGFILREPGAGDKVILFRIIESFGLNSSPRA